MKYSDWLHSCLEEDAARSDPGPALAALVLARFRETAEQQPPAGPAQLTQYDQEDPP